MRGTESIAVGLVAVLLALSTVAASGAAVAQADENAVTVALEDVEASPGETITVTLSTADVDDLAGYEATVDFDPSVVQLESVSGVDLDDPVHNVDDENGTVTMTQSEAQSVDGNPDPVLAELTFSVVGDAGEETALELSGLNVNNEAEKLPTEADRGSVTVAAEDDDGDTGDDGSGDDSSDGLPGFTVVGAVGALVALSAALASRRRTDD